MRRGGTGPLLCFPPGVQARASEGHVTPAVSPEYRGSWRTVRRAVNPGSGGTAQVPLGTGCSADNWQSN